MSGSCRTSNSEALSHSRLIPRGCPARHCFLPSPALTCSRHARTTRSTGRSRTSPLSTWQTHTFGPGGCSSRTRCHLDANKLRLTTLWHPFAGHCCAWRSLRQRRLGGTAAERESASAEAMPACAGDLQSKLWHTEVVPRVLPCPALLCTSDECSAVSDLLGIYSLRRGQGEVRNSRRREKRARDIRLVPLMVTVTTSRPDHRCPPMTLAMSPRLSPSEPFALLVRARVLVSNTSRLQRHATVVMDLLQGTCEG